MGSIRADASPIRNGHIKNNQQVFESMNVVQKEKKLHSLNNNFFDVE